MTLNNVMIGLGVIFLAILLFLILRTVAGWLKALFGPTLDTRQLSVGAKEICEELVKMQSVIEEQREMVSSQLGEWLTDQEKKHDEQVLAGAKRAEQTLAALDSLVSSFDKFTKSQDNYLRKIFGGDAAGYTDMNPEEEAIRNKAEAFQKRYNIPWKEAVERAKAAIAYEPGSAMRENV